MSTIDRYFNVTSPAQRQRIEADFFNSNGADFLADCGADLMGEILEGKFGAAWRERAEQFIAARLPRQQTEAA